MGPPRTKKDRNSTAASNGSQNHSLSKGHDRLEQLQADHELFLQAFESKWFKKFCFTFSWIWYNTFSLILQNRHKFTDIFEQETWYHRYFCIEHSLLWRKERPDQDQTSSDKNSKSILYWNEKKVNNFRLILWSWTDTWT